MAIDDMRWYCIGHVRVQYCTPAVDGTLDIFSARPGASQTTWQENICVPQPLFVPGIKLA